MKEKLVKLLLEKKRTISTMESCTGGAIVNAITNVEGASQVLKFSAVTYSNEYKIKMGVSSHTIDQFTVYSKEVAREMSKAISDFANSDYGVGITGKLNRIDPNNLVGDNNMVFISIYDKNNNECFVKTLTVGLFDREVNKNIIEKIIFNELIEILEK